MRLLPLLALCATCVAHVACDVCDGEDVVDSATVRSQEDADDLEGVLCILGDLEVGSLEALIEAPIDLAPLEDLQIIEGDFDIAATSQLFEVDLPNLTFVGRRGLDRDGERVRGGFFIQENQALQTLDLPALTDVGGCFEVTNNPALDADEVDDLFRQVRSHAFPGSCNADIEQNSGNFIEGAA